MPLPIGLPGYICDACRIRTYNNRDTANRCSLNSKVVFLTGYRLWVLSANFSQRPPIPREFYSVTPRPTRVGLPFPLKHRERSGIRTHKNCHLKAARLPVAPSVQIEVPTHLPKGRTWLFGTSYIFRHMGITGSYNCDGKNRKPPISCSGYWIRTSGSLSRNWSL